MTGIQKLEEAASRRLVTLQRCHGAPLLARLALPIMPCSLRYSYHYFYFSTSNDVVVFFFLCQYNKY